MSQNKKLNIVFAGTPEFSVPALQALLNGPHRVQAVLTQPDKPAGRGRSLRASAVKQAAQAAAVPVWQPHSLRDDDWQRKLAELKPDLMVVVAYGLILPQAVLDIPRYGCWNIHASLLPRWRGAAPIQRAILAGDNETGVCIMQMDAGLDTGPVYHRVATPIGSHETAGQLHDRLAPMGARALDYCLQQLATDALPEPQPQPETGVTYAHKISTEEAVIDWHNSAAAIARQVRAFNPWPGARGQLAGDSVKIWQARPVPNDSHAHPAQPGEIVEVSKNRLLVACGQGALSIEAIQLPGKRRMAIADFLNAHGPRLAAVQVAAAVETPADQA